MPFSISFTQSFPKARRGRSRQQPLFPGSLHIVLGVCSAVARQLNLCALNPPRFPGGSSYVQIGPYTSNEYGQKYKKGQRPKMKLLEDYPTHELQQNLHPV